MQNTDYILCGFLGSGLTAQVYKCRNKNTNKKYAMKLITLSTENWLQNEILILKLANHRNIIKYVDTIHFVNNVAIITEYIAGIDLGRVRSMHCFSEKSIKSIMTKLLSALVHLHKQNIYHGDVRLGNIIVKFDNSTNVDVVKLIDFGFAAFANSGNNPVAIQALDETYSNKTDVWLAGIVMAALLYGPNESHLENKRYPAEYVSKLLDKVRCQKPHFAELLKDMLNCNPNKRISAEECLHSLE